MCTTLVSPAHYGWKMSSLHTIVTFNMRPNAAFGQNRNTTHPRSKRVDRVLMTPGPFAVGSYGERAVAGANAAISIRFLSAMSSNGVVAAVEGANAATCMRVGQTLQTQLLQAEVKTKAEVQTQLLQARFCHSLRTPTLTVMLTDADAYGRRR